MTGFEVMTQKRIALVLAKNPEKFAQFDKMCAISARCTSDTGIRVTVELYDGGLVRYLVTGTRSSWTATVTPDGRIVRKPRGIQPWDAQSVSTYGDEILAKAREIMFEEFGF